jgi:hypothetical protein
MTDVSAAIASAGPRETDRESGSAARGSIDRPTDLRGNDPDRGRLERAPKAPSASADDLSGASAALRRWGEHHAFAGRGSGEGHIASPDEPPRFGLRARWTRRPKSDRVAGTTMERKPDRITIHPRRYIRPSVGRPSGPDRGACASVSLFRARCPRRHRALRHAADISRPSSARAERTRSKRRPVDWQKG